MLKWNEPNVYPSEPIFVPSPNAKASRISIVIFLHQCYDSVELNFQDEDEDDGVILSAIIWGNGDENKVGLLVLCARTLKELGRCVFETPGPIPKCLHGWFAPRQSHK